MKRFLLKCIGFASIGVLPIVALYVYYDPFKVLYHYDTYMPENVRYSVGLNMGHVSTNTFINNNDSLQYNTFILGNSRSCFYHIQEWEKYLEPTARPYHLHAGQESLWALEKKVQFVHDSGNDIDHLLLIFDHELLVQDENSSSHHLRVVPPALVGYRNLIGFHLVNFKTFCSVDFLQAYLDHKLTGEVKPYMTERGLLQDKKRVYDVTTNEIRFDYFEEIAAKGEYYTPKRMKVFYERDTTNQQFSEPVILENQQEMLQNIQAIAAQHSTNVKIVISPLYDQQKLNPQDLTYLQELFGAENVFDFSGINHITNDYRNYYEHSHYRPNVTREIMRTVYGS